jgi:radical SAM protein (TIGR01212 family)
MFRPWLYRTFGRDVHRVALDAGSTCPNRDGSKGFGGCTYCDVEGSGTGALKSGTQLAEQLRAGIERVRRRDEKCGVIAYFQSYSNTYVSLERLREVLSVVEPHIGADVVAVSIATRPDTLPDESLDVLAALAKRVSVWVELGLETADDRVREAVHRMHSVDDFRDAVRRSSQAGLTVIGHAILGLPGDGRAGARATADVLAESGVDGVKVHNLMVLRRTQLAQAWLDGRVEILDEPTYVEWLADFVERLRSDQVIHRLTADALASDRLAPSIDFAKSRIRDLLCAELVRRGTRQGSHCAQAATVLRAE